MKLKTVLFWAAIALVVYIVLNNPTHAAGMVGGILTTLKHAADAVITFVQTVFK